MNELSLAGTPLEYFHVCAFFDSREQEYDVLIPFFKEAIEQGEKTIHIINPATFDDHRERLSKAGIDTHACEACGQLELHSWGGTYLDECGTFNKDRMLTTLAQTNEAAKKDGYTRVRIMGNMDWVFNDASKAKDILAYEAEVNEVLSYNRQPAICVYDIAKLSGSMMMDLLRTHPLTLINGVVQENPFYTPASEMLEELKHRQDNSAGSSTHAV
ncbi:DcmR-like sensory protein [Pseudomonas duriflava]|uniref:DcmR-like sensory protein n=1 Tax=Pseudomonas duriflava TaxID=459528 RepID=A0A562Q6X4_9PSED|nr:MEDS domain-containing protein [Pseudomonas duriflava]TWI52487.1 DcmR-like sensory protein [Pseudomonas duriflava]